MPSARGAEGPEEVEPVEPMVATLKRAAAALRDAGIPFAVAGGFAAWARGGSASEHDVDLMICAPDVDRALEVLAEVGMRTERPPEEWLVKAWDGDVQVDLIFRPSGVDRVDDLLERAEIVRVAAMDMPVIAPDDLLVTKLGALWDHNLDYEVLLRTARELREQVDWQAVRERTAGSPFARAFFSLAEDLEIVPRR